ncbi:MAG: HAMP domain-containing histidine kinase [Lewinellaceae bacterium]|nr:HAMP domain-containing histidine kinase [Lewinellaceae bacterium]
MKLLEKNNRIFFRFTALLLVVGIVLFYLVVNWIIRHKVDETLRVNRLHAVELLRQGKPLPQFAPILEVHILSDQHGARNIYSDTLIYDPVEKEEEPYRQLITHEKVGGQWYEVINRTSLVESSELMLAIGGCTLGLGLLLFVGLAWLNSRSARRLWRPFQQQLDALKNFSLSQQQPLHLVTDGVSEFEELKTALQQLTEKVRADYRNLKEFTENASHEIQTPLAIIRSKIESLVENEQITDKQMKVLEAIYQAANRLSRINQSLLLLAKIENRQFEGASPVLVNEIIDEQLKMLEELTDAKNLHLRTALSKGPALRANRPLIEILIKNLLENAIRYSQPGDTIKIESTPGRITFGNPGKRPVEHPERLFGRFQKQSNHHSSTGLGLAIVSKICEVNGWKAGYDYQDGQHEFSITFQQ